MLRDVWPGLLSIETCRQHGGCCNLRMHEAPNNLAGVRPHKLPISELLLAIWHMFTNDRYYKGMR